MPYKINQISQTSRSVGMANVETKWKYCSSVLGGGIRRGNVWKFTTICLCVCLFVWYFKSQRRGKKEISRFKIGYFANLCFRFSGIWCYLLPCDTVWCGSSNKCIFYSCGKICKGIFTIFFWSTAVRGPPFVKNCLLKIILFYFLSFSIIEDIQN